jgi:hypothetical protein
MTAIIDIPDGNAARAVREVAAAVPAISLAKVLERAELQVRFDRKYFVPAPDFVPLAELLDGQLQALEIDRRRSFHYESRYFDTPDFLTYREHGADRPFRFKVRTRSYLDSGETMFEVKLGRPDGRTIKRRLTYPFDRRDQITSAASRHLSAALRAAGRKLPRELAPTCVTLYRRTTFLTADSSTRITVDHDLAFRDADGAADGPEDLVLVEVKSAAETTQVDRALNALGIDPVRISKYCVGVALLRPELPSGPWDALLERHFDRARAVAAA